MLNKLSYNLMNSLNESEEIEIKKISYTEKTYLEEAEEVIEENIETSEEKDAIEERLASLKTQLEVDGDQLADDEKAALQNEIAELENQLAEDEVDDKIMNEEDEWGENPIAEKNGYSLYKSLKVNNTDGVDYASYLVKDKDGNGVRSFIVPVSGDEDLKATKKLDEKELLTETGEWDDDDEDMTAWKEDLRGKAEELAKEVNGECKVVKGFDKYQGPFAIVATPKHGDIEVWFDGEDSTGLSLNAKIAHVGWIQGGVIQLAELLNLDEIPEDQVLTESVKLEEAEFDAIAKLKAGDEVFFRDEGGQALMGHYAESYPEPEEYDEGYTTGWERGADEEFDKAQDEIFAAAKEAAENREVWEFIVTDDAGQPLGEVYTLCYGEKELADFLTHIREVKKVTRLEEAYSETFGGDIEDFIGDIEYMMNELKPIADNNFATKLAQQMVEDFMETCSRQLVKAKRLASGDEFYTEADDRTYTDADEAEYYRNKELYAHSCLKRHLDAMNKAKEACEAKGIKLDEAIDGTEEQIAQAREDSIEKGLVSESEEAKDIEPIAEAEVKGLKEVKSQGNIYMLEDETNKFIVGENYVESEGLIENAEIYDNKEDADKDYLGRCEITGGEEA